MAAIAAVTVAVTRRLKPALYKPLTRTLKRALYELPNPELLNTEPRTELEHEPSTENAEA